MSQPTNPYHRPPTGLPPATPHLNQGAPTFGVISLLAGLASWMMCCCDFASLPLSILSIGCGHRALREPAARALGMIGLFFGYTSLLRAILTAVATVAIEWFPDEPPPLPPPPVPAVQPAEQPEGERPA